MMRNKLGLLGEDSKDESLIIDLLTWMHKDFIGKGLKKKDKNEFRESLSRYCLSIPDAENILKRMKEIDEQMKKDIKEKQNKKEKFKGAKE